MQKFYFIPYAGAGTTTFNSWKRHFGPEIDFCVIELAGHGKRIMDDFYQDMSELCEDVYAVIQADQERETAPYLLGGHCLGAVAAAETAYLIRKRKAFELPTFLVLSGHGGLQHSRNKEKIASKTRDEIIAVLKKDGGFSPESLVGDILDLVIPMVRADAELYERYRFDSSRAPLAVDLAVLYAPNDPKTPVEEVKDWLDIAAANVQFIPFEAGHYFILHEQEKYIATVKKLQQTRKNTW